MASKKLSILIHSCDGTGHLNATIGIGQALANRGHSVSFLINAAFTKEVTAFGLRVIPLFDQPNEKASEGTTTDSTVNPVKAIAEQMKVSGLLSGVSSLEKQKIMVNAPFMEALLSRAIHFDPQMEKVITEERPDLIVLDHILIPPSIHRSGIPFVLMFSGNPVTFYDSKRLPPPFSGYPTTGAAESWTEFQEYFENNVTSLYKSMQTKLNEALGYTPKVAIEGSSGLCCVPKSQYLNLIGFPEELGYADILPLPKNVFSVDAFCRKLPKPFKIPEELKFKPGDKLIYVSMGSMGSIDVELNKRIASALAKTPYKVIFSKGPLADEYELPDNCWGEAYLPQTSILPLVDLCITHGGNNTVTETFSFGVPMIVLPLFADQFDNAQRIDEKGFGFRLEPYSFTEEEMIAAVEKLLHDEALKARLKTAAKRIESSNSKARACERLERLVQELLTSHANNK